MLDEDEFFKKAEKLLSNEADFTEKLMTLRMELEEKKRTTAALEKALVI